MFLLLLITSTLSAQTLIITHPSSQYDGRMVSKPGIEQSIATAHERNIPVIFLKEPDPALERYYFVKPSERDLVVNSVEGEHSLRDLPNHVISAGGRFDACQWRTMRDVFKSWDFTRDQDFHYTIIADASYVYGEKIFPDNFEFEVWRREIDRITTITEQQASENEALIPKRILSLAEMMDIMTLAENELDWNGSHLKQLNFLATHVADTTPIPRMYRIEIKVPGRKRVYRESMITDPRVKIHTVTIEIIPSYK